MSTTAYHGLFSEALNSSALTSGVSPQTGVFQACLKIAEISVGIQQPATFTLNLLLGANAMIKTSNSNSIFDPADIPLPERNPSCASFNVPFFNLNDGKWFTSGGGAEIIDVFGVYEKIELVYHKTKDIIIAPLMHGDNSKAGWVVKYKDGMVEYYREYKYPNNRFALLDALASPSGHLLKFEYDEFMRITKIYDASNINNKIAIDYGDGMRYAITQSTYGQNFKTEIELERYSYVRFPFPGWNEKIYYLVKFVSLPNMGSGKRNGYWFKYIAPGWKDMWDDPDELGMVLKKIQTPYGLTQEVTYTTLDYGYVGAELKRVPVVAYLYTTDIGNGAALVGGNQDVVGYQFRSKDNLNNYTGYVPNTPATPGKDACIYKKDDYMYTTIEVHGTSDVTLDDGSVAFEKEIIRTFNRFHLLVNERIIYRDPGSLSETVVSYKYPVKSGDIYAQPNNFQFWIERKTVYVMKKNGRGKGEPMRPKIQTQEFDEYGNLLKMTAESGISSDYAYYDPESTAESGCPSAQNGMKCYLKSIETTPNQDAPKPLPANKRQEFTYKKVNGNKYVIPLTGGETSPYMVLPAESKVKAADGMLTLSDSSYNEGADKGILIGALHSIATRSPEVEQGGKKVEILNSTEFKWKLIYPVSGDGTPICIQKSVTNMARIDGAYAPEIYEGSVEARLADGLVVTETDSSGTETKYEYDEFGRLVKKTAFANRPDYIEVEEFSFEFPVKYKYFGRKNLVTYKKVRSNNGNDASIYFRYYLGGNFQVCAISQGRFSDDASSLSADPNDKHFLLVKSNLYKPNGELLSETFCDVSILPDGEQQQIEWATSFDRASNTNTTILRDNAKYLELVNPGANVAFRSITGSPICYCDETNDYGSVNLTRICRFGINQAYKESILADGYRLVINEYDGFGRQISTGNPELGFTKYQYDELDRVLKEQSIDNGIKSMAQEIVYQYGTHIPSMELPILLECKSFYVSDFNIMNARREYDAFSRLVKEATPMMVASPLPLQSVLEETYEYSDSKFPYSPTTVFKSVGKISFKYDDCTGVLVEKQIVNGSGGTQPPSLNVNFIYDKKTKLLQQSAVFAAGNGVAQCCYDYKYDRFDRVISMEVSHDGYSLYVMKYQYTKLLGLPTQWVIAREDGSEYWRCDYRYDSIGRMNKILYVPSDRRIELANISLAIEYVDNTRGYAGGKIASIVLESPEFASSLKKMKILFDYDDRGLEVRRTYSIFEKDGTDEGDENIIFTASDSIAMSLRLESREIGRRHSLTGSNEPVISGGHVSPADGQNYDISRRKYGYNKVGGGILSFSDWYNVVGDVETMTRHSTYFTVGCSNFDRVSTNHGSGQYTNESYAYSYDRVLSISPLPGEAGKTSVYEYNKNGNVSKDANFNLLRYNAENTLSTFIAGDSSLETKYYYSPSGLLNRIKNSDDKSVFYFYYDDVLAGEGTPGLRVFYIRAEDILIGRVLVHPDEYPVRCELELFATDSAGSVRAAYKFAVDGTAPDVKYYDYSDYGERVSS
ncbi:RHS repeat domain-containing protein [Burkholderia ubonensis]|uniref:RHS repeat domain-containing protein n=1 Tax=Burkholderia ubonensis TaxID=101571 RepID=UPI0009B320C0|nr:RHS repeat domain-containing protein [Burkholderia ubonensis]